MLQGCSRFSRRPPVACHDTAYSFTACAIVARAMATIQRLRLGTARVLQSSLMFASRISLPNFAESALTRSVRSSGFPPAGV